MSGVDIAVEIWNMLFRLDLDPESARFSHIRDLTEKMED